jgi:hypothetical protein
MMINGLISFIGDNKTSKIIIVGKKEKLFSDYPLPSLPPGGKEFESTTFPPWGKRERG